MGRGASEPFQVCYQRIERAKAHRQAMADMWNAFLEQEPYDVVVSVDADGRAARVKLFQVKDLPPELPLELGECLYQLRATLDACVYEAACVESRRRPPPDQNALEFPIYLSPGDFEKAGWKMRPLAQEHRDLIESVQPYKAVKNLPANIVRFSPHRTLEMLNDWAKKDRHRKLHVVGSWASNIQPFVDVPFGVEVGAIEIPKGSFFLEPENEIAKFALSGWNDSMYLYASPNLTIDIGLDEGPPAAHDNDTFNDRMAMMVVVTKAIVEGMMKISGIPPRD